MDNISGQYQYTWTVYLCTGPVTSPRSDVADINPVLAGQFDRDLNLWAFCSQFYMMSNGTLEQPAKTHPVASGVRND